MLPSSHLPVLLHVSKRLVEKIFRRPTLQRGVQAHSKIRVGADTHGRKHVTVLTLSLSGEH